MLMSFAACSSNGSNTNEGNTPSQSDTNEAVDGSALLNGLLDSFKADEQYAEYKAMFRNTTFEEKVEGDSIILNISGNKDSVDIIVSEYGKRSDLTYQSIVSTVKKLQPTNIGMFEKYFTELKEGEDDGFKVSFTLDESLKAEHEFEQIEGAEYTVVHFGA